MVWHVAPGVALAIGIIFLVLGISVIVFRRPIHRWIVDEQRRTFGSVGGALSRRSTPTSLLPAGILAAGSGGFLVIVAVTSLTA
jgi:hypothetical protein